MGEAILTGNPEVDLAIRYLDDFVQTLERADRLTDGTIVIKVNDYTPTRLGQIRDILAHLAAKPRTGGLTLRRLAPDYDD